MCPAWKRWSSRPIATPAASRLGVGGEGGADVVGSGDLGVGRPSPVLALSWPAGQPAPLRTFAGTGPAGTPNWIPVASRPIIDKVATPISAGTRVTLNANG